MDLPRFMELESPIFPDDQAANEPPGSAYQPLQKTTNSAARRCGRHCLQVQSLLKNHTPEWMKLKGALYRLYKICARWQ